MSYKILTFVGQTGADATANQLKELAEKHPGLKLVSTAACIKSVTKFGAPMLPPTVSGFIVVEIPD